MLVMLGIIISFYIMAFVPVAVYLLDKFVDHGIFYNIFKDIIKTLNNKNNFGKVYMIIFYTLCMPLYIIFFTINVLIELGIYIINARNKK